MARFDTRHRVALKIFALGLAGLLWLVVSGERMVERSFRVPLEFANLPNMLEIVGDPPAVVDVRVKGSSGALGRVAPGDLAAVLDLETARRGRRLFHLTGADVQAPFGVEVVQVTPATIAVAFEVSKVKRVPVVPSVEGEPAAGFVVGTVASEPASVEVVGPESAIDRLTEAITEPVSVTGATASLTEAVTVGAPDGVVRLREPVKARVSVAITPAPVEWAVTDVPVRVEAASGRRAVPVPGRVTVRLRGPREAVATDAAAFEASVTVEGLQPGEYVLPVKVVAPARVGVLALEPAQVRVQVR